MAQHVFCSNLEDSAPRWFIDNPYREWGRDRVECAPGDRGAAEPGPREGAWSENKIRALGDSSYEGHVVDALAAGGDEGRRSLRYASGSGQARDDPGISEWGNPTLSGVTPQGEPTRGTETSQYPEERKSKETPPVAASERGTAQTTPGFWGGVVGPAQRDGDG